MNRPAIWTVPFLLALITVLPLTSANGIEAVAEVLDDAWSTEGGHFILGDTVELTGERSAGTNLTYVWDMDNWTDADLNGNFTDDLDGTGENLTWLYESAENRTVTLTVKRGNRSTNATVWVNMSRNRPPALSLGSFSALVGETVDLMDAILAEDPEGRPLRVDIDLDGDGGSDINWTSGAGGDTGHIFTEPGTLRIGVQLSDGHNTVSDSLNVTVLDPGTVESVSNHYSNDDQVLAGAYIAYRISIDEGDTIDLNYRVVKGKGRPGLLVMDSSAFSLYKNYQQRSNVTLIEELSNPNGTLAELISWEADRDGTLYFVIDNGYQTSGGSEAVSYLVIIDVDRKRETPGFGTAITVLSLAALLLVSNRRRGP